MPTSALKKHEWRVYPCDFATAKSLVYHYHYAKGASNTYVYLFGLYRRDSFLSSQCAGVSWWIPPTKGAAIASWDGPWRQVLSLSRLVLSPDAPKNAASFLLAHSTRQISRERWPCLITYADTWRGHDGTIYRAAGWEYQGTTKPERCYVKRGVLVSRKRGPRTFTHAEMLADGAECVGAYPKIKYRKLL